jgi:hypothetical protein
MWGFTEQGLGARRRPPNLVRARAAKRRNRAGWWAARRRYASRVGPFWLFAIYAVAMGGLFLAATVIHLVIEHLYRNG